MERQIITVDIAPGNSQVERLGSSQGDIGRPMGVYIIQDGVALDCSAYSAELYILKPDGKFYTTLATVDSTETNLIKWETALQETPVAGACAAQIRITAGDDDIGTARFVEFVEASPCDMGSASESEVALLTEYVRQARESATSAGRDATTASGAASSASGSASTATAAASTATQAASAATAAADRAEAVEESIPADYSQMSADVTELKSAFDTIGDGKYLIGDPIVFENAIYDTTNKVVKPLTDTVVWCYPLIGGKSYTIKVTNRTNVLFGVSNTLYNGVEMPVSYFVNADVTEYVFNNAQNYAYLYITKKGQSTEYGIYVSYPFWNVSLTRSQMNAINETTKHLSIKANSEITPYIDGYLVAATGDIVTNSNFRTTDFIDIAPAKNIVVMMPRLNSSFTGAGLAFYDVNKNYINDGGIKCNVSTETTAEERIIEVPQNARYIRTTVRTNEWDGFYAKQDDIYINALNIQKIKDKASTFGVQMFAKIGVIGDSISCGWAKDKNGNNSRRNLSISWPQQLARRCGCIAYNLGASGVDPIEWFQSDYEFAQYCYTQYQSVDFCDLYIVGLGLNPTSSIGSTADINQSDYTQNAETFYGQYARIIQMINADHPDAIVICVTEPTTRIASTDQAVRDICALSFINANLVDLEKDYFDLFNTEEIISERQPDGLHYTPYGYSLLADAMETALNDYIAKHTTSFKYVGVASV